MKKICFVFLLLTLLFCPSAVLAEEERDARMKVEKPWINSNVIGTVTEDFRPSQKDDFYVARDHDWLASATLKPGRSRNSGFDELQDDVDAKLRALMTDPSLEGHDADLVRNLYALWMDWDARNKTDLSAIKKHTDAVEAIKTLDGLTAYFKSEECLYHGAMIAGFGIGIDNRDSSAYNVELAATGLSLGDSAEYKKLTENGRRTKKMSEAVAAYMLKKLGYTEDEAQERIRRAFAFEEKLAGSMMTHGELYSPEAIEKMYNPVTLQELRERSKVFPFADILDAHGAGRSRLINLEQPEWLARLNQVYTEENLDDIKAYLVRNIASSYIRVIDEASYREYQRLANERFGITQSRPDNEAAAQVVHSSLPVPLSRLFAAKHVGAKAKEDVTGIIHEVIGYYREMLETEDWLSPETRKKAIEKLNAITIRVAYPDKWEDYGPLEIGTKESGETLLSASEKLRRFRWALGFEAKLNQKVDREIWPWDGDIAEVNAYYSPSNNAIMIIAGILGGVFYGPEMSVEEKLGGIGAVIGHEISHAFDTNGAQFDKDGNVANWWTEEDYKTFQARADRLIQYFSGMVVTPSGEKYDGKLVQTESIADMTGIKAMLGLAKKREHFDYDKFFAAYANIWRLVQTREAMDSVLKRDVHALPCLRVNAVLQQFKEFHETYGLRPGDGMYLAESVAVW